MNPTNEPGRDLVDPATGVRIRILATARDTAARRFEVEIHYPPGRGREGQQPHLHPLFEERFEVVAGSAGYELAGVETRAAAGASFAIPRDTPHLNPYNIGPDELHLRQWVDLDRPDRALLEALEAFVETGFGLAREGRRPNLLQTAVTLAALQPGSYAARPPIPAQRVAVGGLALLGRLLGYQASYARYASAEPSDPEGPANAYHFLDRWLVPAPPDTVWDAIVATEHYPRWWGSVYQRVEQLSPGDADGLGSVTEVVVRGPLPYRLRFRVESVEVDKPLRLALRATGDLVGSGVWRLRAVEGGTEVAYDWRPRAEMPLIRRLSPVLKPLFRWNHDWCMRQGERGLTGWLATPR